MNQPIEKVTLADATDRIKGKIRDAFVELLTPEQFRDVVHTELQAFMTKRSTGDSEFGLMCRQVFSEHIKTEVRAVLSSPEYQQNWGIGGRAQVSDVIKDWLTQNQKQLIEATVLTLAGDN